MRPFIEINFLYRRQWLLVLWQTGAKLACMVGHIDVAENAGFRSHLTHQLSLLCSTLSTLSTLYHFMYSHNFYLAILVLFYLRTYITPVRIRIRTTIGAAAS